MDACSSRLLCVVFYRFPEKSMEDRRDESDRIYLGASGLPQTLGVLVTWCNHIPNLQNILTQIPIPHHLLQPLVYKLGCNLEVLILHYIRNVEENLL